MSKFITLQNQKIYLICNGTSSNKVIDSINNNIKSKTSFFSTLFSKKNNKNNIKKINYDEFPILENIGIKECMICKENSKNKILFEKLNKNNDFNPIYTSLDYNSIESSMILFSNIPNIVFFPLPYMCNSNIKNKESFDTFKKKFGNYVLNDKDELSILKEYWNTKMLNNEFINIKNQDSIIDWEYSSNFNRSSVSYKLSFFKKQLEELLTKDYINSNDTNNAIRNNIFVCNDKLIGDMLALFKSVRFNKKKNNIEVTSIWELTIDIKFKINSNNKIVNKEIIYKSYNKFYPTEFNSESLMQNNGKYYYKYDDEKYLLFNSSNYISLEYLKNMKFRENNDLKQEVIKKIITLKNKNKNKNSNTNSKKNNKNSVYNTKVTSYEKLI
jgi:hypothetical protein